MFCYTIAGSYEAYRSKVIANVRIASTSWSQFFTVLLIRLPSKGIHYRTLTDCYDSQFSKLLWNIPYRIRRFALFILIKFRSGYPLGLAQCLCPICQGGCRFSSLQNHTHTIQGRWFASSTAIFLKPFLLNMLNPLGGTGIHVRQPLVSAVSLQYPVKDCPIQFSDSGERISPIISNPQLK
jgi:hypothetical protein